MIDDPLLPAAAHLVGSDARSLLAAAVQSAGGSLLDASLVQIQHRPSHDVVARFEVTVAWCGGPPRAETLLAGCTPEGAPAGTLPMEADGIHAGVWRYPFDPRLPGLATAVTPGRLARYLDPVVGPDARLEVVAYRPIRRAVIRATGVDGRTAYVKVVRPAKTTEIAAAHERLQRAGLAVPEVLGVDATEGLLVLAALDGVNLRDQLLGETRGWPPAQQHLELSARLATVPAATFGPGAPTVDLGHAARSHARAIGAILATATRPLERIVGGVGHLAAGPPPAQVTVHGDLYEAQLMVRDGRIVGLLDLDDVGPGHPLDDLATTLGHLHLLQPSTRRHRDHLRRYRTALRDTFATERDTSGGRELDLRTAAVLVGLAVGPFRSQRSDWPTEVHRRLAIADRLVQSAAPAHENTLSTTSRTRHAPVRERDHEVATAPRP